MSTKSESFTEAWVAGPLSTQIYTRTYAAASSPPRACIVFVHGFIEHIGRYEHVHTAWAAHGIPVCAFDQRGFGRTALDAAHKSTDSAYGKTNCELQMEDVQWALGWAKGVVGEGVPLFWMGHSMVRFSCFFSLGVVLKGVSFFLTLQGGGIVLAFATRMTPPPDKKTVSLLAGVIATS